MRQVAPSTRAGGRSAYGDGSQTGHFALGARHRRSTCLAPASRWYAPWVEKTLAVEMIGLGAIVIARHAARRLVDGPPCASQLNEVTQRGEYPPAGPCPHSEVLLEATMLWGHPCCIKGGPWGYLKEDRLIPRGRPVSHVRAQLSPTNNIRLPAHRFGVVIEPHR